MKVITDFSVSSRPLRVGAGFIPRSLFAQGAGGVYWSAAQPGRVFADTAASAPALFGQSVARVNDLSPNERPAIQSSAALRPLLGRAPNAGRRNLLRHTEALENSAWTKENCTVQDNVGTIMGVPYSRITPNSGSVVPSVSLPTENDEYVQQILAKADGFDFIMFGTVTGTGGRNVTVSLQDGAQTEVSPAQNGGIVERITPVGDGWWLITRYNNTAIGSNEFDIRPKETLTNNRATAVSGDGAKSILVAAPFAAILPAAPSSPVPAQVYQRVGNALDVTEAGVASPPFIRFDLSDDVLPITFPDGGTFDVMVFGRKGSWIERDVEIASAGSLNIGPTTITGGPAALLAALGDIVGWVAVDRTITDSERDRLVTYHKARGAGDLLEAI